MTASILTTRGTCHGASARGAGEAVALDPLALSGCPSSTGSRSERAGVSWLFRGVVLFPQFSEGIAPESLYHPSRRDGAQVSPPFSLVDVEAQTDRHLGRARPPTRLSAFTHIP
jgi:hypothetical protein